MSELNENEMAAYAASIEGDGQLGKKTIEMPENAVAPRKRTAVGSEENVNDLRSKAQTQQEEYNRFTMDELHEQKSAQLKKEAIDAGTALAPINVEDLPSKGMFYPKGTRIWISAAKLSDIKRWTSMDETSTDDINEKVENILESCCRISFGAESLVRASWKDIIDVDRLYLLFAVHDYSFPKGTNDIMVKLSEKDAIPLEKSNVKYLNLSEKLLKYYNEDRRCFSFPVRKTDAFKETNGMMDIYMPKLGVAGWLRDYMQACEQRKDNYDRDMVVYANLLIKDWRGLTQEKYYDLIEKTRDWTSYEWTLISKVRDIIIGATMTPMITYKDNGGVEREAQLSFRDGFKSMFQQQLDIDL